MQKWAVVLTPCFKLKARTCRNIWKSTSARLGQKTSPLTGTKNTLHRLTPSPDLPHQASHDTSDHGLVHGVTRCKLFRLLPRRKESRPSRRARLRAPRLGFVFAPAGLFACPRAREGPRSAPVALWPSRYP